MEKRQLHLLGPIRIDQTESHERGREKAASELPRFRSKRTMALLAYLVAEQRAVAREYLAALFWPDEPLSDGRSNLRRELHNLKDILPDCWDLTRRTVEFISSEETCIDILVILELEATGGWQEAAELLTGDFAEGLYLEDNAEFETWLFSQRENWRERTEQICSHIIEEHETLGRYKDALELTHRLLGLTPWNEDAHTRAMRLLVWSGQENEALRQYSLCERALREELDIEPSVETKALYQLIKAGGLPPPPRIPSFLVKEVPPTDIPPLIFVGRQEELSQLDSCLDQALDGQSQVVFITGSPGSGKTFLMKAFTQRCIEGHPHLLVVKGNCYPYSGTGDPYLPFREIMGMLVGDVESMWEVGAISQEHASRLWKAYPRVITHLLDYGPHVMDVFIQESSLKSRLETAPRPGAPWVTQLRGRLAHPREINQGVDQSNLFHQFTNVIRETANEYPLILVLEDIHWADFGSTDLMFHIGRQLAAINSRVLILCTYRPAEVEIDREGKRHPVSKIINELQIIYGDRSIDLGKVSEAHRRAFVNDFLDTEPNRLTNQFREALYHRTNGHPLFTVELLRSMQERENLIQDQKRGWVESDSIQWEHIPPRVEAVIQERIEQIEPACQEILNVASVEGEVFTAQVIADVLGKEEMPVIKALSKDLTRRYKLVREEGSVETKIGRVSRFQFSHALFKEYLYTNLSHSETQLMHERVAAAIEKYHPEDYEALAYHYYEAGIKDQALKFFTLAGEQALEVFANKEAERYFRSALELASEEEKANLLSGLGEASYGQGLYKEAIEVWEKAIKIYHKHNNTDRVAWLYSCWVRSTWDMWDIQGALPVCQQALQEVDGAPESGGLAILLNQIARAYWFNNKYEEFMAINQRAFDMAMRVGSPYAKVLAINNHSFSMISSTIYSQEELISNATDAVKIAESAGIPFLLARSLNNLGALIGGNDPFTALKHFHRAKDIAKRIGAVSSGEMICIGNIITLHIYLGNLKEARNLVDVYMNRLENMPTEQSGRRNLELNEGTLLGFQGNLDEAIKILTPMWEIAKETNHPQVVGYLGKLLGEFYLELGQEQESSQYILSAIDIIMQGIMEGMVFPRVLLAIKSIQEGNLDEAHTWLDESESLFHKYKIRHQRVYLNWMHAKARLLAAEKNWGQAWALFGEAMEGAGEIGFQWSKTRFKLSWAEAHLARHEKGDREKGLHMLEEVRAEFNDMGADGWVKRVARRIRDLEKNSS